MGLFSKTYYIIVDKTNLEYLDEDWNDTPRIEEAVKFETLDSAKNELHNCNSREELSIYEVSERMVRYFKLIEED